MIERINQRRVSQLLDEFPAVGVLGPRQIGKTTLAHQVAEARPADSVYLDLESPADLAKLQDPEAYLEGHPGKLIILDEIQRVPGLFMILRGVIDRRRRQGYRNGQFLVLGSASLDLLQQSSESLAGRIAYVELPGLTVTEVAATERDRLWLRGGFPDGFLAGSDAASLRWRTNFIQTYLERDIPQLAPRLPAGTLRRLWTMLAHQQGGQVNVAQLSASLDVTAPTARRYLDLLEELLLVRSLRPWSGNVGKRLVKTPKVYIRDSGLTHALLNLTTLDDVLGHPVAGGSWEGFVVENLLSCLPDGATPWFYRTAAGAEIDLVLEFGPTRRWAIEIKRSGAPKVSKGFYLGCQDIEAEQRWVIHTGQETYPLGEGITAVPLAELMRRIGGR
jgi:predicted AAA+ superfamily ATPase